MASRRAPQVHDFSFEIVFQAQRSRGPGGQNVNKTNSSVQLRWDYRDSVILTEEQKYTIGKKLDSHINNDGILHIRSDVHREFEMNKKEVLGRLQKMLTEAFHVPKTRRATKPSYSSKQKAKVSKKLRSEVKKGRQTKWV